MAAYTWSWRNPAPVFGSARDKQLGMKWEEAQIKKQGTLGAASIGAGASVLGEQTRARATLGRQGMIGEQGMAQQTLEGKQGMDVEKLRAETARRGQDKRYDLGMGRLAADETRRLTGMGGVDTGAQNQTLAWANAKKRFDAFKAEMGGSLTDPDTLYPLTPDQEDEFLKRLYTQELGFFSTR